MKSLYLSLFTLLFSTFLYSQTIPQIEKQLEKYVHEKMNEGSIPKAIVNQLDQIGEPITQLKKAKLIHHLSHEYWREHFFY